MQKIIGILIFLSILSVVATSAFLYFGRAQEDAGSAETPIIKPISGKYTDKEIKRCDANSDCVIVSNGCCSCRNGGSDTSINKKYKSYWEEKLGAQCAAISCLTFMNCPVGAVSVCENNTCVYKISEEKADK